MGTYQLGLIFSKKFYMIFVKIQMTVEWLGAQTDYTKQRKCRLRQKKRQLAFRIYKYFVLISPLVATNNLTSSSMRSGIAGAFDWIYVENFNLFW